MSFFELCETAINRETLISRFEDLHCGAFISFEGKIRNHHQGKSVEHLFYESYPPLAIKEGKQVLTDALNKFDIESAYCVHRVGKLALGDIAVWIGVNAAHRDAAYRASRFIIDEIKERVPIWKNEFYVDGQSNWIDPTKH